MYSIYILFSIIIILCISLIIQIKGKITLFPTFLITILILYFLLNPNACIKASLDGAKLFVQAVLPTILPFMVLCNLLIAYGGIDIYSKLLGPILCSPLKLSKNSSFPLIASMICGNPLGAKYSTDAYEQGYYDYKEYSRMISIASNTGPLFLIGSVGSVMLGDKKLGYVLLLGNYLSMFLMALITSQKKKYLTKKKLVPDNKVINNFGTNLKNSIENATLTSLNVAAYIMIFSVIISIFNNSTFFNESIKNISNLFNISSEMIKGLLLGMIEITNGSNIIANSSMSINFKVSLISFLCSFSGLSVLAQISSFSSKYKVPMTKFFMYKLLQGVISFFITYVFLIISYF